MALLEAQRTMTLEELHSRDAEPAELLATMSDTVIVTGVFDLDA